MGNPATVKNLFVTFAYIDIWIIILLIGVKSNSHGIIKCCLGFWSITLFLAILTAFINATDIPARWALPFVVLLVGQWYGIKFFVGSFLTYYIIMAVISLVMVIATVFSLKRKSLQKKV